MVNPCPADAKVRTLLRSWLSAPKTSKNCSGIQKREIPWCPRLHLWIGITATRGTPAHLAIAGGTGPRRIHSPARGRSLSVYPILFLYCHHVELTLKNLILAGRSSEEHRARRRGTSRVRSIPQEHDDLLKRFLQATGKGEMAGMVALLSKDAALHSDGGGRATALPNLIHGADSIPRAIVHGLRKLVPMERVNRIVGSDVSPYRDITASDRSSELQLSWISWARVLIFSTTSTGFANKAIRAKRYISDYRCHTVEFQRRIDCR